MSLFKQPEVRLFLTSLLVAAVVFAQKFVDTSGHVTYSSATLHAAIVAAALVFFHLFTPLNKSVGLFKEAEVVAAPSAPIEPPGETTEVAA